MSDCDWDDLAKDNVPPRPGPSMHILRLRAGERVDAVCLSSVFWGVWTHWAGTHSEPHLRAKERCNGCKRGYPRRWKGYLHIWRQDTSTDCFLEFTPTSADKLLKVTCVGGNLRGVPFKAKRSPGGDKGRLTVEVTGTRKPSEILPPEKDPASTLRVLWNLNEPLTSQEVPGCD